VSSPLHVLVVDDDVPVRRLTVNALASYHFICDEADDGEQASEMLARRKYHAVVTDLKMPRRHGHALALELLAIGPDRPVVVVLTGVLEPRLATDLIARGVDDIVFKPANLPLLAAKVQALCQRRATQPKASGQSTETAVYPTTVTIQEVEERLSALAGALPISRAAIEVANLIQSGSGTVEEIAQSIARDPALSVELLRIANTSGKRIDDLSQAILHVGNRHISELALARTKLQSLAGTLLEWVNDETTWRRCLATSLIVRQLHPAAEIGADEEGLYLSALLLPMSRVLMGLAFPEQYRAMIAVCRQTGCSLASLERRCIPLSPTRAIAGMLARWNLSPRLTQPLKHAGQPYRELTTLTEPLRSKVELLRLAELLGIMTTGVIEPWDEIEFPLPETLARLRPDDLTEIVESARMDLDQLAGPQAARPLITYVRYRNVDAQSHDLLALLLHALDTKLIRVSREEACAPQPVLVNCLDVSEEHLLWFLDDAIPDSRRVLVCSTPLPAHAESWGPVIQLPCSFGLLSEAIQVAVNTA
jgi:DNA-binding response OmpR family regulator